MDREAPTHPTGPGSVLTRVSALVRMLFVPLPRSMRAPPCRRLIVLQLRSRKAPRCLLGHRLRRALDDEARTRRVHLFCGLLRTFVNAGARQPLVLPLLFRHWVLLFRGSLFTRASAPASPRLWVLHLFMWIPFFLTPALVPTYLLLLLSLSVRALDKEILVSLISLLTHLDVVVKPLMPLIRHAKIPPPVLESRANRALEELVRLPCAAASWSRRSTLLSLTVRALDKEVLLSPIFTPSLSLSLTGASSGQRSADVFEFPTKSVAAPVIAGASSGQRSVDVSDSPAPHFVAPVPIGASSGQRSVDVSVSQYRGEVGSIFVAPSSTEVNPGQRITNAHTDERRPERRGASANDPLQRLNPPASQTARVVARRGGRPTVMSSRSSGSTPGQSYPDSIRALAGHARSTAESIARLMAPTRQRPHPRS